VNSFLLELIERPGMSDEPTEAGDGARDAETGPPADVMANWETIVEDMEATAGEYESADWTVVQLHPGDVQMVADGSDGRTGLDLLVPDNEYREVESLLESGVAFDDYEVYRNASGGVVYVVVVAEDPDAEAAILYPAYYRSDGTDALDVLEHAREEGRLQTFLRRLSGEYVELSHENPDLFVPSGE
jgi:hypothetical protein